MGERYPMKVVAILAAAAAILAMASAADYGDDALDLEPGFKLQGAARVTKAETQSAMQKIMSVIGSDQKEQMLKERVSELKLKSQVKDNQIENFKMSHESDHSQLGESESSTSTSTAQVRSAHSCGCADPHRRRFRQNSSL